MGLFSSFFASCSKPQQSNPSIPPTVHFDATKIYPYIVPAAYLEHQSSQPEGLTYPLGHGLHVTLVHDLNGLARNVLGDELATANLTPKQAHGRAIENLVALVKSGAATMQRFDGPQDRPFIIFTDHWLAASCVLLPDLRALAMKHLGTESICICLPQRDSMLLFPTADEAFRTEMMAIVRKNEAHARKPLTFELFRLDADGVREFIESR